jgi:Holliday junction resolvase RusA-like endonuclease
MTPITFRVDGNPVPQPRPKVSTRGGFARAFVPARHPVHEFRARVAHAARDAGLAPADRPVSGEISAVFGRPRSHFNRAGVRPTAPALPRPDVDNRGKAVLDGLQDVMGDDTRVTRLVVTKAWGAAGSTLVTVVEADVGDRAGGVPVAAVPRADCREGSGRDVAHGVRIRRTGADSKDAQSRERK